MDVLTVVVWSKGTGTGSAERGPGPEAGEGSAALLGEVMAAAGPSLAALGVAEYIVNVRDEKVAGARIDVQVTDLPVLAVVRAGVPVASVAACARVIEALGALGPVSAWSVTASQPLPIDRPTESGPSVTTGDSGEIPAVAIRCDGMANIAFLRRPERIPREQWLSTWLEDHTQVAIDTQSTTGYTQHVVVRALTGDAPVIDGIVEEIFPIEAVRDLGVFFDSRGDDERMAANMRAMAASTARFLDDGTVDAVPTGRYVVGVPGSGV